MMISAPNTSVPSVFRVMVNVLLVLITAVDIAGVSVMDAAACTEASRTNGRAMISTNTKSQFFRADLLVISGF